MLISPKVLQVSHIASDRPDIATVQSFLEEAFADNSPVAFLNLCNGSLHNLDRWHWVTLVSLDKNTSSATMCDQGVKNDIDLELWLRTNTLGGGFVELRKFAKTTLIQ